MAKRRAVNKEEVEVKVEVDIVNTILPTRAGRNMDLVGGLTLLNFRNPF